MTLLATWNILAKNNALQVFQAVQWHHKSLIEIHFVFLYFNVQSHSSFPLWILSTVKTDGLGWSHRQNVQEPPSIDVFFLELCRTETLKLQKASQVSLRSWYWVVFQTYNYRCNSQECHGDILFAFVCRRTWCIRVTWPVHLRAGLKMAHNVFSFFKQNQKLKIKNITTIPEKKT